MKEAPLIEKVEIKYEEVENTTEQVPVVEKETEVVAKPAGRSSRAAKINANTKISNKPNNSKKDIKPKESQKQEIA